MSVDPTIYRWDHYSDQPATIDGRVKRKLRRRGWSDEWRKWARALSLPSFLVRMLRDKRPFQPYFNDDRIGLCINLERPFEGKRVLSGSEILEMIEPLELRRIAIRIPLNDIDRLDQYVEFIGHFSRYEILVVLLQERGFIEDKGKLEQALRRIFSALAGVVARYQIGNAVNRLKWGFVSQREYFVFFQTAWNLRNREFPDTELLGGAVIDFELQEHLGALYNRFRFEYDGYASLLYVDRRGAPENRQFGFDLIRKIELLRHLVDRSGNVRTLGRASLWITEVNWPLRETGPFSPSLDDCRVGEVEQVRYLVRYYLLALATGAVAACFWHQLVAPGYGLIDNRGGRVRRRPAFQGFATLCRLFNGAELVDFKTQDELGYYRFTARKAGTEVIALWRRHGQVDIIVPANKQAIGIEGEWMGVAGGESVTIGESVVYLTEA